MAMGHVFLHVLSFSLAGIIPPLVHTHSFICHQRRIVAALDSVFK